MELGEMIFNLKYITDFSMNNELRSKYFKTVMDEWKFSLLGEGHSRRSYLSPNMKFVLKFPVSEKGLWCNRREHEIYRSVFSKPDKTWYGAQYAPCRLIQGAILYMKAVAFVFGNSRGDEQGKRTQLINCTNDKKCPTWASYMDCRQVGIMRDGRVVAYDYPR